MLTRHLKKLDAIAYRLAHDVIRQAVDNGRVDVTAKWVTETLAKDTDPTVQLLSNDAEKIGYTVAP
jgi:hypothetical protein